MDDPDPAAPPVIPPVTVGAVHVYVVPAGTIPLVPFTGVVLNATPVHTVAVIAVIDGFGLTVTVTVNVLPAHAPDVGVTVYVAVCAVFVGLVSVPVIDDPDPATPPVIPPVTVGAVQVYVVPAGTTPSVPSTGVAVNALPLHTAAVIGLIEGLALTVTVTVNVLPTQAPDVGVTVYVAVCAVFVELVSVPEMDDPDPAAPPVIPPVTVGAVQVYVVPAGTTPFVPFAGVTLNAMPLHTVAVIAVTEGFGLTVTVTVNVLPAHAPDVGVTVYVAVCAVFVGFVKVPVMDVPDPATPPVIPPVTVGALQVYVVPAGTTPFVPSTGVAVNEMPLHTAAVIAVIEGFGLTVTVTVNVLPAQPPDVGVTVYVAVCALLVGLVSVPVMDDPDPATPPVIPPVTAGAVQVYVVPAGTTPFVPFAGVAVNAVALHTVAVIGVIEGCGLTVTVTVNVLPTHVPDVGVTVYVAVCAEFVGLASVPVIDDPDPATPPVIPPVTVGALQL